MSQTVSSRLLSLTRSTLKTGGWIVVITVVYTFKREGRVFPVSSRLAITIFNSLPPVEHDSCVLVKLRSCVCAHTVLVFSAKGDCVQ